MSVTRSEAVPFTLGFGPMIDALLGLRALQKHYEALPPGDFVDQALARLDIRSEANHLERVPRDGAAIAVVNHPTGAMDGLLLLSVLRRVRPDVRVLGNEWLTRIPEMREWTIPLNIFTALPSQRVAALRSARRWLGDGGLLVVFPAGEVARRCREGVPLEDDWQRGVLALASWTAAPVVPVHLGACPSRWIRVAARVNPWLKTAMLPRELLRQRGARVPVEIGEPIPADRLDEFPDAATRLAYLRARVQAMARRKRLEATPAALSPRVVHTAIAREVESLPPAAVLVESGPLRVLCASAAEIPLTLREIGRLREQTFRAAGEGTGEATDLDRFDASYLHLFLWHRTRCEIVGAYRMRGTAGSDRLYTETLFTWRRSPRAIMGEALELGRSFVRAEYQRDPAALLLLWKGIGACVARSPHRRRLFGPVSVSADYGAVTRHLIAGWLTRYVPGASGVDGRRPPDPYPEIDALLDAGAVPSLAALEQLVRELENGRGLPVLLRQYLRLNGRVLAISRDPAFADAMDVLLVVDLLEMPSTHLDRYCGRAGAAQIRRYWQGDSPETACALSPAS